MSRKKRSRASAPPSALVPVAHPWQLWRKANGLSLEAATVRLQSLVPTTSAATVYQLEGGFRRPSWDFAAAMASVTDGAVATAAIMEWHDALRAAVEAKKAERLSSTSAA